MCITLFSFDCTKESFVVDNNDNDKKIWNGFAVHETHKMGLCNSSAECKRQNVRSHSQVHNLLTRIVADTLPFRMQMLNLFLFLFDIVRDALDDAPVAQANTKI